MVQSWIIFTRYGSLGQIQLTQDLLLGQYEIKILVNNIIIWINLNIIVLLLELNIGVARITQYMAMHKKNSNTQGSSPNVVKVIFHTLTNCS